MASVCVSHIQRTWQLQQPTSAPLQCTILGISHFGNLITFLVASSTTLVETLRLKAERLNSVSLANSEVNKFARVLNVSACF